MKMNKAQSDDDEFATKLRENFGLKSKSKKDTENKTKSVKIENGLGVVAVDEELVLKKNSKKPDTTTVSGSVEEGKKCLPFQNTNLVILFALLQT